MGPLVPENFLCWQKEKGERKKRRERKKRKEKKGKKENRKQGWKYSGPWDQWYQKIFYAGRKKKGKEEKGGKKERKEGKEGKGKKEKKQQKKKNRKKKRVTAPISSHFVQGQILGVGGAPKIISERTLIVQCSLICRQPCSTPFGLLLALYCTTSLVPKFAMCIVPLPP